MPRIEFEIIDHGVDHAQHFPGCGVAFSRWAHAVTGASDGARQAADDAAEQVYTSDSVGHADACLQSRPYRSGTLCTCHMAAFSAELDAQIEALSEEPDAHADCEDAGEPSHEECELYHYVSIRWRVED